MPTIFTRIVNGELPSYKIAEDDHHFAFLDINPAAKGHTLVIPKQEVDYIFDLDDMALQSLHLFAKKVAAAIDKSLKPIRTGIIVEGMEVPHVHIHLIPIYHEMQAFSLGKKEDISAEDMKELAEEISKQVEL